MYRVALAFQGRGYLFTGGAKLGALGLGVQFPNRLQIKEGNMPKIEVTYIETPEQRYKFIKK